MPNCALVSVGPSDEPRVRCLRASCIPVTSPIPLYALTATDSLASEAPSIKVVIISSSKAVTLLIDHVPSPKIVAVFPTCNTPFTATATVPLVTVVEAL